MNQDEVEHRLAEITEDLADIEHKRWAHWQRYMHNEGERRQDGSLVIPADLVTQWDRQIATPYCELAEEEKESDREQVRKYLPTIIRALCDT